MANTTDVEGAVGNPIDDRVALAMTTEVGAVARATDGEEAVRS